MTRLCTLFALLLALALPATAFATAQVPDRIRIDGEDHALHTNPLARKLASAGWERPEEALLNSANWRGYVAFWEIADDRLLLLDATMIVSGHGPQGQAKKSILPDIFPSATPPLVAEWYSGALVVPQGEVVEYVHMGYESVYERYLVFRISEGKVLERLSLSPEELSRYRDEKFEAFTRTDEFRKEVDVLRERWKSASEAQLLEVMKQMHAERYMGL